MYSCECRFGVVKYLPCLSPSFPSFGSRVLGVCVCECVWWGGLAAGRGPLGKWAGGHGVGVKKLLQRMVAKGWGLGAGGRAEMGVQAG